MLVLEGIMFEVYVCDMVVFFDILRIDRLYIVGVLYGVEVGMYFVLMYFECVKLLILGIVVSESDFFFKVMIELWIEVVEICNGRFFFKVMVFMVYLKLFYVMYKKWLDDYVEFFGKRVIVEWMDVFVELCCNFFILDVIDRLFEICLFILVISVVEDIFKFFGYG